MDASKLSTVVAIIVVAGLALAPFCKAAVDSFKATGVIPSGWSGVMAICLGAAVGGIVGVLVALMGGDWYWVLLAGIAGAFSGTGAIVHNQASVGAQVEQNQAVAVAAVAAPAATTSAKPATTPSSVVFTPAADPKASSSGALDV